MCTHVIASGPTSGPQLYVLIVVLVVSSVDCDLTNNYMFMHECLCECMNDCYRALPCMCVETWLQDLICVAPLITGVVGCCSWFWSLLLCLWFFPYLFQIVAKSGSSDMIMWDETISSKCSKCFRCSSMMELISCCLAITLIMCYFCYNCLLWWFYWGILCATCATSWISHLVVILSKIFQRGRYWFLWLLY